MAPARSVRLGPAGREDVLIDLGRRIREAREDAGLTQEDAASLSGIDWRRWQRLESGSGNPTVKTLMRTARVLGLSFWELVVRPRSTSA